MKGIFLFCFSLIAFSGVSQISDTNNTTIYTHASDYRNYYEAYLGNLGLAKFSLINPFETNNPALKSLFPSTGNSKTYTDITYISGAGNENYFDLEHNQQLGKYLFGKASITRTSSIGNYRYQFASLSDFDISLWYNPKSKRYNFNASFGNYKRNNQINGGVEDSTFFSLLDSNNSNVKATFPVKMQGLSSSNPNYLDIKSLDAKFGHSFSLSKSKNDTSGYVQLVQQLSYNRLKKEFVVLNNNQFFDDYFYDSVITQDSLRMERLSHNLGIQYHKNGLMLEAGFGQNYFEYVSYSPFETHLENYLYGQFSLKRTKLQLTSYAEFLVSEGKYESFEFKNSFAYRDDKLKIFQRYEGRLNILTDLPELNLNRYESNHFKWNRVNARNSIVQLSFNASNENNGANIGFNFESQSNAVFYDSASQIGQTGISYLSFSVGKIFKLTKWMHLSSRFHFQDIISEQAIEVPNFLTYNKLYFKARIIKKILAIDAGINVLYYSSFKARAYNPALDEFFIQTNQHVGNYPIIDLFAEFYLKKNFTFFATMTHLNSNLFPNITGKNYLITTNYPRQDRALKFGFKWRLFD